MKRPLMLLGIVLAGGVLAATTTARADVQACLTASEKGQRARSAGKLREARDNFVVCGAESCPAIVRKDCAQWNSELAATLPTVVFGARDKAGRDLFDVTVSMDGEVLVKKLDGKSVTVDPGKHTFRFDVTGYPSVTEVALIKEGERARVFNVTFDSAGGSVTATPTTGSTSTPPDGDTRPKSGDVYTPYPWIVVALGAVGVAVGTVIVLTAPDRPGNCKAETQKCTRLEGQSDEDFRKNQEQAGTADSQPTLGFIVGGVGLGLVVGGLVWHFLEPSFSKGSAGSQGLRVLPWSTTTAAGVSLGRAF